MTMKAYCAKCNKPLQVMLTVDGLTCNGCPDHPDAMVTFIDEQKVDPPLQFISPEGEILNALQYVAKYAPQPIQPDPSQLSDTAHMMLLPQVALATMKFARGINALLAGGK